MNLEPFKYFNSLHYNSKPNPHLNKNSKRILYEYFENRIQCPEKINRLGNFNQKSHGKKTFDFIPFLNERDSIGNILTKGKNRKKSISPITNLAKVKLTKDTFNPSNNKVLVFRNQFCFFEKGKKPPSKKSNSLLNVLLNDKFENENNLVCSTILKKNSISDISQHLQLLERQNPTILSLNDTQTLTESAKYKDILKYHITPKETNFTLNKNSLNKNCLHKLQKHKKLVDPIKFKKLMDGISLLGQYDNKFSLTQKKSPICSISKTQRMNTFSENLQNTEPVEIKPSKEFFSNKRLSDANCDSRNEFAKIMRDIEKKVDGFQISSDKNLWIPEHLSWKYDKSKKFVSNFKKDFEKSYTDLKKRVVSIKTILTDFH